MPLDAINVSVGDPPLRFTYAFDYACRQARKVAHIYDNDGRYDQKVKRAIHDFFYEDMDIRKPNYILLGYNSFTFTNGVTDAFSLVSSVIAKEVDAYNKAEEYSRKPVMIMPIPTYGYFADQAQELGFKMVYLEREPDGSVSPKKLDDLITQINSSTDQRVAAYYDSNPNNPTGHIRDKQETKILAEVFIKHNKLARRRDQQTMKEIYHSVPLPKGPDFDPLFFFHPKEDKMDAIRDNPYKIRIIEDMVYLGNEYGEKKAASFASIRELFQDTFLLAGGSKIGLAGVRTGLIICDEKHNRKIQKIQRYRQYFLSPIVPHAIEVLFSKDPKHVAAREEHFQKMNEQNLFSGKLMKALINGIDDVEVSSEEKEKMIATVAKYMRLTPEKAALRLQRGLPHVRITTNPESGFFHLLDCSALKGKFYTNNFVNYKTYLGETKIKDETELHDVFSACNLRFCSGTFLEMPIEKIMLRLSFAFKPRQLIRIIKRLERSLSYVADNPEKVQHPHTFDLIKGKVPYRSPRLTASSPSLVA